MIESVHIIPKIGYIERKNDVLMICTHTITENDKITASFKPYGEWKLAQEKIPEMNAVESLRRICDILNLSDSQREGLMGFLNRYAKPDNNEQR